MGIDRWLGGCAFLAFAALGCTSEQDFPQENTRGVQAGLTAADCPPGYQIIQGTPGPDVLNGTPGNDCILGLGGDDLINGRGGEDVISGGPGDDTLLGGNRNDRLHGDEGNDDIQGGGGDDFIDGGEGDDTIDGGVGHDTLRGGAGDDELAGGVGDDTLDGGDGDDVLDAGIGNDVVSGGDGNDHIASGFGNDSVDAGAGNDTIDAGRGTDSVLGGDGNDVIIGDNNDTVDGGAGNDACEGGGCETGEPNDCSADGDCPTGMRCLPTSGVCVACVSHDECNDGLFCNGTETCVPTTGCVSGIPPTVDDGDACTVDGCDEVSDTVVHVLRDADGDLVCDDLDGCPTDPQKIAPGTCGCDVSDADADADGFPGCLDCDDDDDAAHPGLIEVCDGVDNDCNDLVDDGADTECDDRNDCTDDACAGAAGCSNTAVAAGTSCASDTGVCTAEAACDVDQCAPNPCQNAGRCTDTGAGYACSCRFGYAGTNCESAVAAFMGLAESRPSVDPNEPPQIIPVFQTFGVSGDGRVVVGGKIGGAWRWTEEAGAALLGFSVAIATNSTGDVVVGHSGPEAVRWTQGLGVTGLGTKGAAFGTSSDGSLVVGNPAFRWTEVTGPVLLGALTGDVAASAFGVSADGFVTVGFSRSSDFRPRAVRWLGQTIEALDVTQRFDQSEAIAVSGDGAVVVGHAAPVVFRWTATNGMAAVDNTGISMMATNGDGSRFVGATARAVVWDATSGSRSLETLLIDAGVDLRGWRLQDAVGISSDGLVVVGNGLNPFGQPQGFIARLPEEDIDDCAAAPCQNGASCREGVVGYFCDCPPGYDGVRCELVDGCDPNPCENGGACSAEGAGYLCTCPAGVTGTNCEEDVDECASGNGGCDPLTTCTNTLGSRTCGDCPPGYAGNGESGCVAGCDSAEDCPAPVGATPTCVIIDGGSSGSGGGGGVAGSGGAGGANTGGCGGEFPCGPPTGSGGSAGTGGGGNSGTGICGYDANIDDTDLRVWPDIPNAGFFLTFWAGSTLNAHQSRIDVTTGVMTPLVYPPPSGFANGLKRQSIWIDVTGTNRMALGHHENLIGHDLDAGIVGSWVRFGCCDLVIDRVWAIDREQGLGYWTGPQMLFELDLTTFTVRREFPIPGIHSGYVYVGSGIAWIGGDGAVGRVDLTTGAATVTSVLPPRGHYLPPGGINGGGGLVLPSATGELVRVAADGTQLFPIASYPSPNPAWTGRFINDGGTPEPMPTLVLGNGLIVLNTGDPGVSAYDQATGDLVWHTPTAVVVTALLIGDGNIVYAYESGAGRILGLDLATGIVRYRFDGAPASVPGHPSDMALRDGVLYATANSRVMAIRVPSVGYPADAEWPTIFHDNQRTSNYDTAHEFPACQSDSDVDADGVCDDLDNCPTHSNTDQADEDADGLGDVCDDCIADFDGDGSIDCGVSELCGSGEFVPKASIDVGVSTDSTTAAMLASGFTGLGFPPTLYTDAEVASGQPITDGITVLAISRKALSAPLDEAYLDGVRAHIAAGGSVIGEFDGAALFFTDFFGSNTAIPHLTPSLALFSGTVGGGGVLLPTSMSMTSITDPSHPVSEGLPPSFTLGLRAAFSVEGHPEWLHEISTFTSNGTLSQVPVGTFPATLVGRCGSGRVALFTMNYFQVLDREPVMTLVENALRWVTGADGI